ncbi:MAG: hypothetical protein QG559_663 [Campylobacterota bacterium]|nr:hypothetical protein [Campylobacterota bacterium]
MDLERDLDNSRNNQMYYNQIQKYGRARHDVHKNMKGTSTSFGSQKVEFSNYLLVIEGYEGFFYAGYVALIPYIVGSLFLYFFVANGSFGNYKLLETEAFFIVWLIGYEIVAAFMLIFIFVSFLMYDKGPKKKYR